MKHDVHPHQSARLAALRAYDILDTPREEDFDDIVQFASDVCDAPISVMNLIDADRQWFKAEVGLGVKETPLELSICKNVILGGDFVEIPDTHQDPRTQGNTLCMGDGGWRFYAGAPLLTGEGLQLGTLCVLDFAPRKLTAHQRNALLVLARQIMAQLDLRLALKRQALLQKEIDHRVKNSLQAVAALVHRQLRAAKGADTREALEHVEQQVRTIALIHEELYRNDDADTVDLGRYMTRLGDMLRKSAPPHVAVRIAVETGPLAVTSSRASALGMILNEFVTNSLKHAFPGHRTGAVVAALRPAEDNSLELLCEDDGVGFSTVDRSPSGLGVRLMEAAAAQIGGRAEFLRATSGFGLRVTFPR